jgi:hypothetical protein
VSIPTAPSNTAVWSNTAGNTLCCQALRLLLKYQLRWLLQVFPNLSLASTSEFSRVWHCVWIGHLLDALQHITSCIRDVPSNVTVIHLIQLHPTPVSDVDPVTLNGPSFYLHPCSSPILVPCPALFSFFGLHKVFDKWGPPTYWLIDLSGGVPQLTAYGLLEGLASTGGFHGFLPLDEFYFSTVKRKFWKIAQVPPDRTGHFRSPRNKKPLISGVYRFVINNWSFVVFHHTDTHI